MWHVDVEGCLNFRDAGGWPTTDGGSVSLGRLYRSDDPIRMTATGRQTVEALGLALVVDLRQPSQCGRSLGFVEPERTANLPLVDQVVDVETPPPLATAMDITNLYLDMLAESREQIALVLDRVAESLSTGPVLLHCAFGKDRTGLVAMLILAALGVQAGDLVAEYVRSDEPSERRRAAMLHTPLADDPQVTELPDALFRAVAATMEALIDRLIVEHGTLAEWVRSFPIDDSTIARLRAELIEYP